LSLARVGPCEIAIDAALVQAVEQGPISISPFPRVAPHVLGAFAYRGASIPVVDLATVLSGAAEQSTAPEGRIVVILTHPAGRLAVHVDALHAMIRPRPEHLTPLEVHSPRGAGLFTNLYQASDDARISVVLDLDALLRIDDLHLALHAPIRDRETAAIDAAPSCACVLIRAGVEVFALDAAAVRHVQRSVMSDVQAAAGHATMRGFVEYESEHVAVVDLLSVLGLPPSTSPDRGSHLVIIGSAQDRSVALQVDRLESIERLTRTTELHDTSDAGALFAGSAPSARNGVVRVLDAQALLHAATVLEGPTLRTQSTMQDAEREDQRARRQYMVYRAAGGLLATPVGDITAVTTLPASAADQRQPGSAQVAVFTWQDRAVTVHDLGVLMGFAPLQEISGRAILMVGDGAQQVGLLVEEVSFLHQASPRRIPGHSRQPYGVVPVFEEMVSIGSRSDARSAAVLDVRRVGERLTTRQAAEPAVAA